MYSSFIAAIGAIYSSLLQFTYTIMFVYYSKYMWIYYLQTYNYNNNSRIQLSGMHNVNEYKTNYGEVMIDIILCSVLCKM